MNNLWRMFFKIIYLMFHTVRRIQQYSLYIACDDDQSTVCIYTYWTFPQAIIVPLLGYQSLASYSSVFQDPLKKIPNNFYIYIFRACLPLKSRSYNNLVLYNYKPKYCVLSLGIQKRKRKHSLHAQSPLLFHFSIELSGYPKYIQDPRRSLIRKHGGNFIAIFR